MALPVNRYRVSMVVIHHNAHPILTGTPARGAYRPRITLIHLPSLTLSTSSHE
jgi:hypothetical protein